MKSILSQNEKYIVQGQLADGHDIKDIAKSIGRQAKTVQHFVDNELDKIHTGIAKAQTSQLLDKVEDKEAWESDTNTTEQETPKKKPKRKPKNDMFINKTGSGAHGVAISTHAASSVSDALKKTYANKLSRVVSGNIYKIDDQEVQE